MPRLPFSPGFEPLVGPGDYVKIVLIDQVLDAVVVAGPEPVHVRPAVLDVPGDREVELDAKDYVALGDYEIGVFRIFTPQPLVYRVNQPPSTRRFGSKYMDGEVFSGSATHLQEVYVYRDIAPRLLVGSALGIPLKAAIGFLGYKWEVRPARIPGGARPVLWPVAYMAPVEKVAWG